MTAAAFGLSLVLEKPLAGLECDGVDAALERLGDRCILLEAGTRLGLFAEQLEEHRRGENRNTVVAMGDEDTHRSRHDKWDEGAARSQTSPDVRIGSILRCMTVLDWPLAPDPAPGNRVAQPKR